MRATTQPSDEDLLKSMLTGDGQAFETLYDRRQGGVYRFALRMCGSTAMAEDITQDVFIELMRDGSKFDPAKGTVASYLFGITRHRVLRRLQRERSMVSMTLNDHNEMDSQPEERPALSDDPLLGLSRQETIESVRQAVLALPLHYREVVVLCNLQEMNYEQAATIIGCPIGTVRSRLNRARAMLADKLREYQALPEVGSQVTSLR